MIITEKFYILEKDNSFFKSISQFLQSPVLTKKQFLAVLHKTYLRNLDPYKKYSGSRCIMVQ
jgi:hypothetical protein